MKLTQDDQKELKDALTNVNKILKDNKKLKELYLKKEQIISYLTLMNNSKENKELIKKFNEYDKKLRKLEEEAAFLIANEEKANIVIKKTMLGEKRIINKYDEQKYENKFNKVLKETNYLELSRQRSDIFKKLVKINLEDCSVLYKLDSLETEISIIETDTLREYLLEN